MATQLQASEAERLARDAAAALQAGRSADARRDLERIAAAGRANAQIWLMLAYACRAGGDPAAAGKAADEVLTRDNRNLRALIVKGDALAATGSARAAHGFYMTAIKLAQNADSLPADLAQELERVERAAAAASTGFRERLDAHLGARGFDSAHRTGRFQESLGILLEEKQVHLQQPSVYYFPGLPHIQFYEPETFAWAAEVEAATDRIGAELAALLACDAPFKPYLESRTDRPSYDFHGLLDNPAWSTLYLWENGGPAGDNAARCPATLAALRRAPLCEITTRAPSILFSLLRPGARIAPHNGMINTRLICHLPLIVPPGCGFRVGNEVRQWEVGKLLIFDDTIEHEAWNDSGEDRIVLIFDVWRPELAPEERGAVAAMFEALDAEA